VGVTVSLAELNAADRGRFVDLVGGVFEDSPWVAERAWPRRPFRSVADLHAAMVDAVAGAERERQLALLRAHPDLGSRARMSEASAGEQAGAGLDRLAPGDVARLQELNAAYRRKFDFPFLFAVKGSTPRQVLDALAERLDREAGAELEEALRQVARIARFRLEQMIR
jgi:2-oxo-4-hydroxy-4-carboxy-5-ureidoimidazoline decarboxylase